VSQRGLLLNGWRIICKSERGFRNELYQMQSSSTASNVLSYADGSRIE
jgi:hypothetical protein